MSSPGMPSPRPSGARRIFQVTAAGRILYLIGAAILLVLVSYNVCSIYVEPNQMALKQVIFGANKGISPEIYRPGLHWMTPAAERFHTFPTDIQMLTLTDDPNEKAVLKDELKDHAFNIQTNEGYKVTVDTTVLYRIVDPYKVITSAGPGKLYESSLVAPHAEKILRNRLGELDTEEFYDVVKRTKKVELALQDLNDDLNPSGIKVLYIFVRRYVYDDRYQKTIEQRKVQDQMVFKNKAEAELATATAEKDKVVAEGQAKVRVELATGDAEKQKLDAQAELYERTQRSAGEKELKLADAEGTRLEAEALKGTGSEYMVGLKMADALSNTKVIVIPTDGESGVNPLDLKSALKRFDVTP
jgi:regulator of protease activity HflC (stomatin/prohibitin superfamily)